MNYQNDLQHTGVKGMKWGHHRYTEGRLARAKDESALAKKLATGYTNSLNNRLAKKPNSVNRQSDVIRGTKLANAYTKSMDNKVDRIQSKLNAQKAPATLTPTGKVSSTTKKVIDDYNAMNEQQFKNKYYTSKQTYAKRVEKYGDPYMNSPLAKMGKQLNKNAEKRDNQILNKQAKKGELNSQYSKQDRLLDQQMYGTRGVRNISKRMDKGQSHKRATNVESGKQFLQGTALTVLTIDALSGGELHKDAINAGKKFVASEAAR